MENNYHKNIHQQQQLEIKMKNNVQQVEHSYIPHSYSNAQLKFCLFVWFGAGALQEMNYGKIIEQRKTFKQRILFLERI